MKEITREQLIEIAKAGFPQRVMQFINLDNCEINAFSGVYRLYDKDVEFMFMLPKEDHLSVFMGEDNFIQINAGIKAFNHYAAIKKMEELGLIENNDNQQVYLVQKAMAMLPSVDIFELGDKFTLDITNNEFFQDKHPRIFKITFVVNFKHEWEPMGIEGIY